MKKITILIALIILASFVFAQSVEIKDSADQLLLQVNDEGTAGSITIPDATTVTTGTNNKLYNEGGTLKWNGSALGTGGSSLWTDSGGDIYYTDGKVGIGLAAPKAALHVYGNNGLIVKGTYNSGVEQNLGAGTRLHFYSKKAAFRAGLVLGDEWDDVNIGKYSVAMGNNTIASGEESVAMGEKTTASGESSTAMGYFTEASEDYSTAMGSSTTASGISSTAMGHWTTASEIYSTTMGLMTKASGDASTAMGEKTTAGGESSTAMGYFTKAESQVSLAIGRYNIGGGTADEWIDTDPIFEIGNGIWDTDRSNALTVLKNGQVGIGVNNVGDESQLKVKIGMDEMFGVLVRANELGSEIGLHTATSEYSSLAKNCYFDTNWKRFDTSKGAFLQEIEPNGNVTFKTVASDVNPITWTGYMKLQTNGSLIMENGAGGYYSTSDHQWHNGSSRNIKRDIKPNDFDTMSILDKIEIVNYRYKTEVDENPNAMYHVGFIAEDTPPLLSGNNQDGMATGDSIGFLLAVVKEQQNTINDLTERIECLESN